MPIIRSFRVSYKWLLPAVFGALKKEIVRSAVVVFSALSVVCYVRLLWGMSDVVGLGVGVLDSFFLRCVCVCCLGIPVSGLGAD
jgi:hypothetical protein